MLLETSTLVLKQCLTSFLGTFLTCDEASNVSNLLADRPLQNVGLLSLRIVLGRNLIGVLHLTQSVSRICLVVLLRALSGLAEACFAREEVILYCNFTSLVCTISVLNIGLELVLSLELILGVTQLTNLGEDEVLNL